MPIALLAVRLRMRCIVQFVFYAVSGLFESNILHTMTFLLTVHQSGERQRARWIIDIRYQSRIDLQQVIWLAIKYDDDSINIKQLFAH